MASKEKATIVSNTEKNFNITIVIRDDVMLHYGDIKCMMF